MYKLIRENLGAIATPFVRRMKSTLIILVGLLAFFAEASLVRVQNGKFVDEGCKEFHFTG